MEQQVLDGGQIAEMRARHNVSREKLAQRMNLYRTTLTDIEMGRVSVTEEWIEKAFAWIVQDSKRAQV